MTDQSLSKLGETLRQKRQANLNAKEIALPAKETDTKVSKITLKLPASAHKELRRYALEHDTTMQDVLVEALNAYVRANGADWQVGKPTK